MSPFTTPQTISASDGESLRLPPVVDAASGTEAAIARYRLLAIEQGERVMRGTAAVAARATDELERDLFLLRESAAIDAAIARSVRNVAPALAAARADALARRPLIESLAGAERDVEQLVRQVLEADPSSPPPALAGQGTAEESLAWARGVAEGLRSGLERYRGITPVAVWGRVLPPSPNAAVAVDESGERSVTSPRLMNLVELAGAEPSGPRRPVPAERGAAPEKLSPLAGAQEVPRGVVDDDIGSAPQPGIDDLAGSGSGADPGVTG